MENNQTIKQLSQQIQVNPFSHQLWLYRSQVFSIMGKEQQAIIDLSKSLYLQKSVKSYLLRGQIYSKINKFKQAIQDFQEASQLYQLKKQQAKEEQDIQTFMQKSICINQLPNIKKIIHFIDAQQKPIQNYQLQLKERLKDLFIFQNHLENKFNTYKQKHQFQLQKYKELLQIQNKILKQQQQQIKVLGQQIKLRKKDYQVIFQSDLEISTLSEQQKHHFRIYFHRFCSQMEKFYLSAKILNQLNIQNVSFEDFSQQNNKNNSFVKEVFKLVDKLKGKVDRVEDIVKQIPYLGSMIKFIKAISKGVKWLNQVKQKNQCQNILSISSTISSFNHLSAEIGYHLSKHYKIIILNSDYQIYNRSSWKKIKQKYQLIKKDSIGNKVCQVQKNIHESYIKQIAQIHSGIIIMGFAYSYINIKSLNETHFYERIYEIIEQIEKRLKQKNHIQNQEIITEKQKQFKKYLCCIY